MTLVVDASVAIKWLVREDKTVEARALLTDPQPLIAPDWLLIEAASAFWNKVKRSELLAVHAEDYIGSLPAFFKELVPSSDLVGVAFRWSVRLRHSPYDCLYLALAEREDAVLMTADEDFYRKLSRDDMPVRAELI